MTNNVSLPTSLNLNKELAWLIGFYYAEGNHTRDYIGVSNCNFNLIQRFKKVMDDHFNINNNLWKYYIRSSDIVSARRWLDIIPSKKIMIKYNPNCNEDNIELRLNSRAFTRFFNKYLVESLSFIFCENELILEFLKGYEVGDGSIWRSHGVLKGISIVTKNPYNVKILTSYFHKLYGIDPKVRRSKNSYELSIKNTRLMTRLILDNHFFDHENKWKIFIESYKKQIYARTHSNYWKSIGYDILSVKELATKAKRSKDAVRDAMSLDSEAGLINIVKDRIPGKRGAPYHVFYSLTSNGQRLLDILGG